MIPPCQKHLSGKFIYVLDKWDIMDGPGNKSVDNGISKDSENIIWLKMLPFWAIYILLTMLVVEEWGFFMVYEV